MLKPNNINLDCNTILAFCCVLISGIICGYLLFNNSMLYMLSDAYYYSSVAEYYYSNGEMRAQTITEGSPVVTTQNGIVWLHLLLISAGVDVEVHRLYVISSINYLCLLIFLYASYQILFNIKGVKQGVLNWVILAVAFNTQLFLGGIQPINDAIFLALSAGGIYLLLNESKGINKWVWLFLLSLVVVHFRFQGVLVFVAILITGVCIRDYIYAGIGAGLTLISILSMYLFSKYTIDDQSGLGSTLELFYTQLEPKIILDSIGEFFLSTLPNLFLGMDVASEYYAYFFMIPLVGMAVRFYLSFRNSDIYSLYLIIYIVLNIVFVIIFPSQDARYLLIVLPLMLYFFLDFGYGRKMAIGYLLVLVILLFFRVVFPFDSSKVLDKDVRINFSVDYSDNKRNSEEIVKIIGSDFDLIAETYMGRVTYFLFGKPMSSVDLLTNSRILFVGRDNGFQRLLAELKRNNIEVLHSEDLRLPLNIRHSLENDSSSYYLEVSY